MEINGWKQAISTENQLITLLTENELSNNYFTPQKALIDNSRSIYMR